MLKKSIIILVVLVLVLWSAPIVFGAKFQAEQIPLNQRLTPTPPTMPGDKAYCVMQNDNGAIAYYFGAFNAGDGVAAYMDPMTCGVPNPYPFRVTDAHLYLYNFAGAIWPVQIQVNIKDLVGGDSCNGPGSILCSETFTIPADSAYPRLMNLSLGSLCCVNGPFFMEIIYTGGTSSPYPSPLFTNPASDPADTCNNWLLYGGVYYEWYNAWTPPVPGNAVIRATGNTQDPDCIPPEAAEPFLRVGEWLNPEPWHNWIGGPDDTSQIQLQIVDPNNEIQFVDFYYSTDGGYSWNFVQRDTNGYEPFANTTTPVDPQGDGWSAYLPHSLLPQIEIVALSLMSVAHMETESLVVRNQTTYDPTPPSSITLNIDDWQVFPRETLYLDVDPILADIESIVVYIVPKPDIFSKGIPEISQQPHSPTHCAPTAAAACLKYFEAQGDTHIAGGLGDSALVDALAKRMGTNQGVSGTYLSCIANGLRSWISGHCDGYTVRGPLKFDWKQSRDELERCQDVLETVYWDAGGAHEMTLNSIVNTPLPDGKIKVDFMDPWTGDTEWGKLDPNTGHLSDFGVTSASGTLGNTIIVCPKEPYPGCPPPDSNDSIPPPWKEPGPNPDTIRIPWPHPCHWWIYVVVIDHSGNAHTEIRVVWHLLIGDANGDGVIDIGDLVYLINYLFKNGPAPYHLGAGDANCDGVVDIGDIVYLINYLFRGGPPPGCP